MIRRDILPPIGNLSYKIDNFSGINTEQKETPNNFNNCIYGYNIDFVNGALRNSIGIEQAKHKDGTFLPISTEYNQGFKTLFFYRKIDEDILERDDRILMVNENKFLMHAKVSDSAFQMFDNIWFGDYVDFANYYFQDKDVVLIYSSLGNMHIYDGDKITKMFGQPRLSSVCVHYGRVFAINYDDRTKINYTVALDPTKFSEEDGGGFLKIVDGGGYMQKIISFKDFIYVFKDFAVYRLTAYTDPKEFKVVKLFETSSYILPETITICGDKITYMTKDGLFAFDGFSSVQIFKNVTNLIDSLKNARCSYYKNKLYVCLTMKKLDNEKVGDENNTIFKNNAIFIFDFTTGGVSIFRGAEVICFMQYNVDADTNNLLCCFGKSRKTVMGQINDSGRLFDKPLKKLWRSPITNFNAHGKFLSVRKTYVNTKNDCEINIIQEKSIKRHIKGGKQQANTYVSKGKNLQLEISSLEDKMQIEGIQIDINLIRRLNE